MELGLDPDAFWLKTLREIDLIMRARGLREREGHNARAWLAWHTAALMRTKPKAFPKLSRLMVRVRPLRPASLDQQLFAVRILNAYYGGKVVKKKASD